MPTRKNKKDSLKSLDGDFIPEKSADEVIDDLKKLRTFTREYDPVFVAKILEGEKARKEGKKGLRVDVENLWEAKPEITPEKLPAHVLKSVEIGLKQIEDGQTISLEEFKERHFSKK